MWRDWRAPPSVGSFASVVSKERGVIQTTALTVSALANVALLGLWLAGSQHELAAPAAAPRRSQSPPPAEADGDYGRWRKLGLDEHEAKRLLFATLETRALGAIESPWERYWQSSDPGAAYALRLLEAYGRVRREIEREMGTAASASPEFSRAFRPLDAQFSFLSGSEQIELQQRRLGTGERGRAIECSEALVVGVDAAPEPGVSLDFLAPAAAFEVALRESPRSEQLRRSRASLDEHEFRETFVLLERADSTADLAVHAATRQRLRTLLGAQRFAAVAAPRDPLFAIVARVGRERGLDPALLSTAYEVLNDAQGQLLDLAVARVDGERAAGGAAAIAATERERLDAAVGEVVATAILAAREEFYVGARHRVVVPRDAPTP